MIQLSQKASLEHEEEALQRVLPGFTSLSVHSYS